jgi:hypothetical protein
MEIKEMKDFFNAQLIMMRYTDSEDTEPYIDALKTALKYMEKLERESVKQTVADLKLKAIAK